MRGAWKEMHFDRIFEAIATLAEKLEISKKYLTTKTDYIFSPFQWYHDTRHSNIENNDTQHNDPQHK
jgi:hypothetical protein